VIPVYNGAAFLRRTLATAWAWLLAQPRQVELLVVDDGSADATAAILAEFAAAAASNERAQFTLLRNADNRGKGFALRRAFLHARGELIVFTDADLTYELDNVVPIVRALERGADVAYGSRTHQDSVYVVAPGFFRKLYTRHFMGRVFNCLVRAIVVRGIRDTQAGLKGFRSAAAQHLAVRVRLCRFSFDVELFFVARRARLRIDECPVRFLYRKEPSTVKFFSDSLAMIADMLRVRWRGLRGVYDREPDAAALADLRHGGAVLQEPPLLAARGRAGRQSG